MQNLFIIKKQTIIEGLSWDATIGQSFQDLRSNTNALYGESMIDPNFVSVNNANIRSAKSTLARRRLVSFFSRATLTYILLVQLEMTELQLFLLIDIRFGTHQFLVVSYLQKFPLLKKVYLKFLLLDA